MSPQPAEAAEALPHLAHLRSDRRAWSAQRARDYTLRRLLATADVLALGSALTLTIAFGGQPLEQRAGLALGLATLPLWVVLFKLYGLYERDSKRVSHATVDDIPWLFHALVIGGLAMWFYFRGLTPHKMILAEGVLFFVSSFSFVFVGRALARRIALRFTAPQRVLFVGDGPIASALVRKMRAHPEYRLDPIAFVEADASETSDLSDELRAVGTLEDLEEVCVQERVDRVMIVAPNVDEPTVVDAIRRTKDLDIRISVVPQVVDVLGPSVEIDDVEGVTVLGINPPVLTRSSRFLKRSMDIAIATVGLVVSAPVLLVAAAAIKLSSPGPVLYSQLRIGRGGRPFRVHKLRTMTADAEARAHELKTASAHPAWLLLERDPRVTPVGRFLRATSIDELPQLWNVLRGHMSLVGPRPMPPDAYEHMEPWGHRRLDLTPGITGLWQVLGRTAIPFEEMVKLDYLYVTNWSLWQDVRLLAHTLPAVLGRRGVN